MSAESRLEELLARYVERYLRDGERCAPAELCREDTDLIEPLRALIRSYHTLDETLSGGMERPVENDEDPPPYAPDTLPVFEGFETIECLGRGGMGEVYKVRDRTLGRLAAAKVLRSGSSLVQRYGDFLGEAQSLALFQDSRIVTIYEFRKNADPPVLLMEYVEGFTLDRMGPSLEPGQKARILEQICEALANAHAKGIQHRDLKPRNILVDENLSPKILDFGLSAGDPTRGHLIGTLPWLAPEQLDPDRPIDDRTDIYALGVILYELLCGEHPWKAGSVEELLGEFREGRPRLPVEIREDIPEPLQAIALRAMEVDPEDRYASAREMAEDLRRFLDGRPVLARPTYYAGALQKRLRPHLSHIEEWRRLKLIYPHEERRLRKAYQKLESREDDWIVESRVLSWSQIALYLGAFLLVCGGLLYFYVHRFEQATSGLLQPALVQGIPFLGLTAAAWLLYRRAHRAVAVAFYLAGTILLPFFLLISLHEMGLWLSSGGVGELFAEGTVSNRQLQCSLLVGAAWAAALAVRTRTTGLASAASLLISLLGVSLLTEFGLRVWLENGDWHVLALYLLPIAVAETLAAMALERLGHLSFAKPMQVSAVVVLSLALELLALNGKCFEFLGISLAGLQTSDVSDPVLLDTMVAMAGNGLLFYGLATVLDRWGMECMRPAAHALVVVSPFAMLQPMSWLVLTGEYSIRFDWMYLALAVGIVFLSKYRQRKSFYLAGLCNTAGAIWFLSIHNEWLDDPPWAASVIAAGLLALGLGFLFSLRERASRSSL